MGGYYYDGMGAGVIQPAAAGAAALTYAQTVAADSPVGYWRLGEASGTDVADSAGSNTGQYIGSPTLGATGAVAGNTAVTFVAASAAHKVDVPDHASLDVGDTFTIEFWLKRASQAGLQCPLDKGTGGALAWVVAFNGANFFFGDSGGNWIINNITGVCNDTTTFHHVVITKSGATTKLYQDGVDLAPATTNQTIASSTSVLRMGATVSLGGGNTWWLNGTLDEVALYATALSAARVSAHYAAKDV
jgi:hypothetical protein